MFGSSECVTQLQETSYIMFQILIFVLSFETYVLKEIDSDLSASQIIQIMNCLKGKAQGLNCWAGVYKY